MKNFIKTNNDENESSKKFRQLKTITSTTTRNLNKMKENSSKTNNDITSLKKIE